MSYQGDWTEDSTHYFTFNTRKTDGTPYALAGTPSLAVYKDDGTTQSTAGLTLTADFDSVTGLNMVKVDTSADAFYAVGHDYEVVIAAGTVNSVSVVGATVGTFSIENRFAEVDVTKWNGTNVATPTTAGVPTVRLSAAGVDDLWDEALEGTETGRQMMRLFRAALLGITTGAGTKFRDLADTKNRIDATLSGGNRTAITTDPT